MTTLLLGLALLVAAAGAHWLLRDLRTVPLVGYDDPPGVSVVVPARNEAAALPGLLESLARLRSAAAVDVVVVDDGSQDGTGGVARAAGATVLAIPGPPAGWTGKAWACQLGADATDGELLLFLDADTELAPEALDGLLALHRRHGGLVSVQPFHEARRAHEQLSAYFNAVSLLASAAFGPAPQRRPMAFGPCLLTSREDYRAAGGHTAVRGDILDDVQLAGAYRRAGLPVHCAIGGASLRMRMYPLHLRQLVEGWTKNFASGASAAAPGPTLATTAWVAAHHAVAVGTLSALVEGVAGLRVGVSVGPTALWAVAWVGVAWQLRSLLRRIGRFRWWTWALFPVPLLAFDLIFARSAVLTLLRRPVRWRGRDVPLVPRHSAAEDT